MVLTDMKREKLDREKQAEKIKVGTERQRNISET